MALLLSLKRTVNLEPGLTTPQVFHVSQNDVGTKLYVGLEQGGTAYTIPDGTTAKVQGCNALGEPFEAITATVSASEVYFTITDQNVTQFAGNAKCEVVLTNGTNILGTANFIVAVEASPMGSDVPAIYTNPVQAYIEGVVQDYVDDDVLPGVATAINGKADASDVGDLTELETTDKSSIVGAINEVVSGKVAIAQGSGNAGKALVVDSSGNVEPGDIAIDIDDTLTQQGEAADAKATGDALALKANASTVAPEFSDQSSYTAGSYVLKNGVLYRFTAAHSGAWTGTDAEEVTVGSELNRLEDSGGSGTGLTEDIKQALLTIAEKVAYIDEHGQDYYDALEESLYPPAGLTRITAVYTQSGVVTNWNVLNDLRADLIVTAYFDNGTSQTVVNYALSGTLEAPQSTITVTYGGKTATFTVIVTHSDVPAGYTAYDYIELTDVPTSGTAARYYTIITDAQMSSDYTVEISLGFGSNRVSTFSADPIIGTRNGGSGTLEYALYMRSNDGLCKVHLWGTEKTPTPKISTSRQNTLKILPVGKSETYPDNNVIEINGTQYNTELSIVDTLASPWFGFFNYATSATGHPTSTTYYRGYVIGETKVTDADGNEVYHFIPAKNSDDIYGFYESVHNRFYYNNYNDGALLSHYTGGNWG